MTATVRQPTNLSLLNTNKWQLSFIRVPNFVWFLQSVNLPGMSMNEVFRATPFVDTMVPGDKTQYDVLNFNFLIDEDMRSWFEIHDWIRGMTFPEKFGEYKNLLAKNKNTGGQYSDATLTITNNANLPNVRVKLIGCFPTMLGSLEFDQTQDASQTMVGSASFRFSYYTVERFTT